MGPFKYMKPYWYLAQISWQFFMVCLLILFEAFFRFFKFVCISVKYCVSASNATSSHLILDLTLCCSLNQYWFSLISIDSGFEKINFYYLLVAWINCLHFFDSFMLIVYFLRKYLSLFKKINELYIAKWRENWSIN